MGERKTAFTRGGYSFRPLRYAADRPQHFGAFRKGDRSSHHGVATIYPASDGRCWTVSAHGHATDARPSFREACDLAMAWLPIE